STASPTAGRWSPAASSSACWSGALRSRRRMPAAASPTGPRCSKSSRGDDVGRKRKDDSLRLPPRVYVRAGTFYYVHRDTGKWENIGRDLADARKRAEHYNDPTGTYGTMAWFLDQFVIDCEQRQAAGDLAKRTVDDYRDALAYLKPYFGDMLPTAIGPHHVT